MSDNKYKKVGKSIAIAQSGCTEKFSCVEISRERYDQNFKVGPIKKRGFEEFRSGCEWASGVPAAEPITTEMGTWTTDTDE